MQQLCLSSQPPILISSILLLYCLQAAFCLGIRLPTSSFAQSTRQARQLDLLHVLQGFVLGILQEISLALGMYRHAAQSQGLHTLLRTKSSNTAPMPLQVPGPVSNHLCSLEMGLGPSCSLVPAQWGRQQPALDRVRQTPDFPHFHATPLGGNFSLNWRRLREKAFPLPQSTARSCHSQGSDGHGTPLPMPLLPPCSLASDPKWQWLCVPSQGLLRSWVTLITQPSLHLDLIPSLGSSLSRAGQAVAVLNTSSHSTPVNPEQFCSGPSRRQMGMRLHEQHAASVSSQSL